ncbi:MAG: molybdate ABC transporter substrate-binding protein, partial [Calditrichaeota bacterium]
MTFHWNKLLLLCALGLCACTTTPDDGPFEPLTVFAAASLGSALPEIATAFQRQHADCRIAFNFAASSILAKQLERGAHADLFVSANTRWLEYLIRQKRIRPDSRIDFLSNRLVVVVPADARIVPHTVHDLTNPAFRRIAVGDPQHVPLGIYARDALQAAGVWDTIRDRLVPAMDARAALA